MGSGKRNVPIAVVVLILGAALLYMLQLTSPPRYLDQPPAPAVQARGGMTGNLEGESDMEPAQLLQRDAIEVEEEEATPRVGVGEDLLQGIVVTANGEPIAGADVELQRRDAQGFTTYEIEDHEHSETMDRTRTEADGTFSFTVPPLRQFALEVTAEAYGPELLFACYGGQYREVVLEEACALEGTVSSADDQSPIEGAPEPETSRETSRPADPQPG